MENNGNMRSAEEILKEKMRMRDYFKVSDESRILEAMLEHSKQAVKFALEVQAGKACLEHCKWDDGDCAVVDQAILSILNKNGIHQPTVSEWMEIATLSEKEDWNISERAIQLMQSWEEIVYGKWIESFNNSGNSIEVGHADFKKVFQPALLEKKHFVCEVKEPKWDDFPKVAGFDSKKLETATAKYESALKEVLFEGFPIDKKAFPNLVGGEHWNFSFMQNNLWFDIEGIARINNPTISDFIYYCDRYNRTASKPIELNWTPAIVDKLLKP